MAIKQVSIFVLCALVTGQAHAQHANDRPSVGEHVILELTGELAREYLAGTGMPTKHASGLSIQTSATIEQQRSDGKYRIEHYASTKTDGKPKMVTLTIVVDPAEITTDITPANTAVYASPAVHQTGDQPTRTKTDQPTFRLKISALESVRLRTWAMVNELGSLED